MPNIVYTVAERVEMVRLHEQGVSYRRIVDHFAATYPNRPIPSTSAVQKIVKKFHATGNIDPRLIKVTQPKKRLTDEVKLKICLAVEEGSKKPLSEIAQELRVSKSSVHKVVRSQKTKCKPYKLKNCKTLPTNPSQNLNRTTSSDFSPLYHALWSYLKNKLYTEDRVGELSTLWDRVTVILGDLDPNAISKINNALDTTPQFKTELVDIPCKKDDTEHS